MYAAAIDHMSWRCQEAHAERVLCCAVGNQLTGSIPDRFRTATRLATFLGYGNSFTGSIPASLGAARSLVTLDLSANSLNGTVPASLVNASELQFFIVRDNLLSGEAASLVCPLQKTANPQTALGRLGRLQR